jgi:endoglucanase Acf2
MKATIGHGLPFGYFQVTGGDAQITTSGTPAVWSNSGATIGFTAGGHDYATWFSGEPEMIQGINMLPITGGHFYLGDNPGYITTNYNELVTNNGGPPTVWQDIIWEFRALGDGDAALDIGNQSLVRLPFG